MIDRRHWLWHSGGGLGGIALAALIVDEQLIADAGKRHALTGGLHHRAKAKRVIQLVMSGAASTVDHVD